MRSVCYTRKKAAELLRGKLPPIYTVPEWSRASSQPGVWQRRMEGLVEPIIWELCLLWNGGWGIHKQVVMYFWYHTVPYRLIQHHTVPGSIGPDTASPMTWSAAREKNSQITSSHHYHCCNQYNNKNNQHGQPDLSSILGKPHSQLLITLPGLLQSQRAVTLWYAFTPSLCLLPAYFRPPSSFLPPLFF